MFNNMHFYHEHIRKAVVAFGTIFNSIYVKRRNTDGSIAQSMLVPLHYAPKQKIIARVLEVPDLETGRSAVAYTLPRMAFEITGLEYDGTRKLPTTQTIRYVNTNGSMDSVLVATPYVIGFRLSIFAKNQDDGLQILEQILPYFTPDFNVTIKEPPNQSTARDLNIVLGGVTYDDMYEGSFAERTSVTWDLTFSLKMQFYGSVDKATLIKKVIANIYADENGTGVRYTGTATDNILGSWVDGVFQDGVFAVTPSDDPTNYEFVEEFEELFLGA